MWVFKYIPHNILTYDMCKYAVKNRDWNLLYVPLKWKDKIINELYPNL